MTGEFILTLAPDCIVYPTIDGMTFQIHYLPGGKLRLIPVTIPTPRPTVTRCPVVIGGEQCGGDQGHYGKHFWAGGD